MIFNWPLACIMLGCANATIVVHQQDDIISGLFEREVCVATGAFVGKMAKWQHTRRDRENPSGIPR